jgi:Nucleotide-diphospho-sugar transferase
MKSLPSLLVDFKRKMGDPMHVNGTRRAVTVMVANEGVMDLALNFICSAEAAGIDLSTVAMFVGTEEDVELVENMGAKAIYSPALGSMPKNAANMYLDATFSRMMWFKTTSVFLAIEAGFDVLFQDVDLVWMKDPIPYLRQLDVDISFMDDGARTPRYTPFFVNSGFYFVKNNAKTRYLQEKMVKSGASEIGRTHSHQSVLIKHLSEAYHLFGMKVVLLDKDLFPSGEAYHERKKYLQTIIKRTFTPYVFHMCWTSSRDEKVTYFQETGLWYLPDEDVCLEAKVMHNLIMETTKAGQVQGLRADSIRNRCCLRERYWKTT